MDNLNSNIEEDITDIGNIDVTKSENMKTFYFKYN